MRLAAYRQDDGAEMIRTSILLLLVMAIVTPAYASEGDTTWVRTFDHDFYNWATAHIDTFTFPDTTVHFKKVLLFYTIGCPSEPGDCDPWDRLGYLQVLHNTGEMDSLGQPILEPFEIARVITPYDITGGNRPDSCAWEFDVTHYMSLLHGAVVLSNYIESWTGDERGWLVTIDFAFIEGDRRYEPYRVVNLWQDYYVLYGNPAEPIEDILDTMTVDIDEEVAVLGLRVIATGHGQGNTNNCAEFCSREHTIYVNGDEYSHFLWRDDCSQNPCHPQGGNWQFPRAGWCPGSSVIPWDLNITASVIPGEPATFDYDVEVYENLCRPSNPDCVDGETCPDCDYNSTSHTPPRYSIQAQLIFYREAGTVGIDDGFQGEDQRRLHESIKLYQNYPNPFNPTTTISFDLPENSGGRQHVSLAIYSMRGKLVKSLLDAELEPGNHVVIWDGTNELGERVSSGIYISSLKAGKLVTARKIIVLK
ncbi:MAG: peptide-N-glycosidase F-related protein [Candidatus Glassbacteria bacterium]